MHFFRKLLLPLILAVTTLVAGGSYAQPERDECGCCTEMQQMVCDACRTCISHALLSGPLPHAESAPAKALPLTPQLNPSAHTEDIWHPPKSLS